MDREECDDIRALLEDIQRTISDNRLFLRKLKRDGAGSDMTEKPDGDDSPE